MVLNIMFWNCHGIRPKCKELELFIKENTIDQAIDIKTLNEVFLNKKYNFKVLLSEKVHFQILGGVTVGGQGWGDNSIQFINFRRVRDKSFKEW